MPEFLERRYSSGVRFYLAAISIVALRADEDLRDDRRRRHRLRGADGHRVLDGRRHRRARDRRLHGHRRHARRPRDGHVPDVRDDRRLDRRDDHRPERSRRLERAARERAAGVLRSLASDVRSRFPVDRHSVRRADLGSLVLVHGSIHRAAHVGGQVDRRCTSRDVVRRVLETAAAVHLRRARRHRLRARAAGPIGARGRRQRVAVVDRHVAAGRVARPRRCRLARGADELAVVGIQLVRHARDD